MDGIEHWMDRFHAEMAESARLARLREERMERLDNNRAKIWDRAPRKETR